MYCVPYAGNLFFVFGGEGRNFILRNSLHILNTKDPSPTAWTWTSWRCVFDGACVCVGVCWRVFGVSLHTISTQDTKIDTSFLFAIPVACETYLCSDSRQQRRVWVQSSLFMGAREREWENFSGTSTCLMLVRQHRYGQT